MYNTGALAHTKEAGVPTFDYTVARDGRWYRG
jgi:hypothetical protein